MSYDRRQLANAALSDWAIVRARTPKPCRLCEVKIEAGNQYFWNGNMAVHPLCALAVVMERATRERGKK